MKKAMLLLLLGGCTDLPLGGAVPDAGLAQLPVVTGLLEVAGLPFTPGAPRNDAIGAAARCGDLLTSCVGATKDPDGCVAQLPICATQRPWEESAPCCAKACVEAYQEERRLGADVLRSAKAVFGSDHECFPGRQELLRAAGGTPYLAPRLAPR